MSISYNTRSPHQESPERKSEYRTWCVRSPQTSTLLLTHLIPNDPIHEQVLSNFQTSNSQNRTRNLHFHPDLRFFTMIVHSLPPPTRIPIPPSPPPSHYPHSLTHPSDLPTPSPSGISPSQSTPPPNSKQRIPAADPSFKKVLPSPNYYSCGTHQLQPPIGDQLICLTLSMCAL